MLRLKQSGGGALPSPSPRRYSNAPETDPGRLMRDLEEAEARAARLEAELSHARGQPDHRYDTLLSSAEHPAGSGLDVGGLTGDCYARLQRRGL
jgi:hypothetical protein